MAMRMNDDITSQKLDSSNPAKIFAKAPLINLDQMGRLRVSHLTALLAVSRSTLYAGIASGRYPEPDGKDGKKPYWLTTTIKAFLEA
jgi:predicted DNA-binding transcriptional regulator AlpA